MTLALALALAAAGLLTFLTRLSFVALLGGREVPAVAVRALRFVPPAVLSAIVASEVFVRQGAVDVSAGNLRLLAAAIATGVALLTRNVFLTIAAGMAALWTLQAVLAP
jgi:branched-subunit amino acid transport protein